MNNFLAPMQFPNQQCSVALMNAYAASLANTHNLNFISGAGGYIGYGPQMGTPMQQAYNGTENEEEDCDDDEHEEQSRTLFCNNLDERVSEEILYEVFLQAGPIESARIPLDNTGRQRSFGFVTYQHKSAVPFAVELYQGLELFQKKIFIRPQCPDKPKTSAPSQSRAFNPFSKDLTAPAPQVSDHSGSRHNRHSMHDTKQFSVQNNYNNNDMRRRSDSAVMDRNRPKVHQQQQHNNSGSNRRSDQRYNHDKRRLL